MIHEDARSKAASSTALTGSPARPNSSKIAAVLLDHRLLLWHLLLISLSPLIFAMKIRRYLRKRSNHEFNTRRWLIPPQHTAEAAEAHTGLGPHVVFVGASFGEMLLIDRMTQELRRVRPELRITWAIRDPHTLEQLRHSKPAQMIAVWPFDFCIPIVRWLSKYSPDVLIFTERYSFPTFAAASKTWGSRVALINGRAKGAYEKLGGLVVPYYRWLFGHYDAMAFQNELAADRVRPWASPSASLLAAGNIKLDLVRPVLKAEREQAIKDWLATSDLPLLVAGSTSDRDEDRFVLDAYQAANRKAKCRLLLAPRKLERVPDMVRAIEERGLRVSLRTEKAVEADVYLLDTLGELAFAYSFGQAAYVGGSLRGMGHNVIEPLEWGIPVSYGPRRGHFEELQRLSERAGVGLRISTSDELAAHWTKVLTDSGFREEQHAKAKHLLESQRGAADRTIQMLLKVIDSLAKK